MPWLPELEQDSPSPPHEIMIPSEDYPMAPTASNAVDERSAMSRTGLSIGRRLGLGFGLLISIILCGTLVAVSCVRSLKESMLEMLPEFREIEAMEGLRAEIASECYNVWSIVGHVAQSHADLATATATAASGMATNAASVAVADEIREHQGAIRDIRPVGDRLLSQIKTAVGDAESARWVRPVEDSVIELRKVLERVQSLAVAGNSAESTRLLAHEGDEAFRIAGGTIDKLVAWQQQEIKRHTDASTQVADRNVWILLIGVAVAAVVGFVSSLWVTRSITRPLAFGVEFLDHISRRDVTRDVPGSLRNRNDETGRIARSIQAVTESLRDLLVELSGGVDTLATSATNLSSVARQTATGVDAVSNRTQSVAAAAEEASSTTSSVAVGMSQAAGNLSSVASATEEMSATVAEIAANSEKARAISEQATRQTQNIASLMQELGRSATDIGHVTETINDISSQTNLLALNATIEAARAGAAGKGFAVVANEIKELARQTADATEDIKAKIHGVQSSSSRAIADIEKIAGVIREVGNIVSSIAAAIEEQATVTRDVAGNIAQASAGVRDSNDRVSQTAEVSSSIARDIASVNHEVGELREGGRQVAASANDLTSLAEQLKASISQFRISTETHA